MRSSTRIPLLVVATVFATLALSYSVLSPPFENPDELEHARYALFISDHGRIPRVLVDCVRMAFHPPLYHALISPFGRLTGVDYESVFFGYHLNRDPSRPLVVLTHGYDDEAFPYSGGPLFIHAARMVTIVPGLVLLWFTWRLGELVFRDRSLALVSTACAASVPQFQYLAGSLNHDALVSAAGAALLFYSSRLVATLRYRDAVYAGAALGVALLAKSSSLALAPIPFVALLVARQQRRPAEVAALATVVATLAFAIAGWWYVDQWRAFGTPFATMSLVQDTWVGFGVRREAPFGLVDYWYLTENVYRSFIFVAGMMSIAAPGVVYVVWLPFFVLSTIGVVTFLFDRRTLAIGLAVILMLVSLVGFNYFVSSPQGRYLFPVIPALATAAVGGLAFVVRNPRSVGGAYAVVLLATSLVPLSVLWSTFAAPAPSLRDATGETARLYCENEYQQPIASSGGRVVGFRFLARAHGDEDFRLRVAVYRAGSAHPDRVAEVGRDQLSSTMSSLEVGIAPLDLSAGERIVVAVSARAASPLAKPTLSYEPSAGARRFTVNGAPQAGGLLVEEIFARSAP